MESHRKEHRVMGTPLPHRQAGITALGFLILATLVGVVGLAGLKVTPMYIKNMRMNTILENIQNELNGQSPSPAAIRTAFGKQFAVNDVNLDIDAIKITQNKDGFAVRVQYESRAPYVADIYLVVAYDKQVEIRR
jgi:hypothetical protein